MPLISKEQADVIERALSSYGYATDVWHPGIEAAREALAALESPAAELVALDVPDGRGFSAAYVTRRYEAGYNSGRAAGYEDGYRKGLSAARGQGIVDEGDDEQNAAD